MKRNWLMPLLLVGVVGFLFFGVVFGPMPGGLETAMENANMQTARTIACSLYQYSIDHDGKYSDAKSSTELFQRLVDQNYITDSTIFYLPLKGKVKARNGARLKPENVAWDVTADVTNAAPDGLPLVFMTGYRIEYKPDGRAIPLGGSLAEIAPQRSWQDWWQGRPAPKLGIAVTYKSISAMFIPGTGNYTSPDGSILHFIHAKTDLGDKTYRQLTPDGMLPP